MSADAVSGPAGAHPAPPVGVGAAAAVRGAAVSVDRLVIRTADRATGDRIAARLPETLDAVCGALPPGADESVVRASLAQAIRDAAR